MRRTLTEIKLLIETMNQKHGLTLYLEPYFANSARVNLYNAYRDERHSRVLAYSYSFVEMYAFLQGMRAQILLLEEQSKTTGG